VKSCFLLLAMGVALLGTTGCTERQPLPEGVLDADRPDQETWNVAFDIDIDGIRRARLEAGYAARYERGDSTFARFEPPAPGGRVQVQVYDPQGRLSATVEAARFDYLEDRRAFVATGDVVVQSVTQRRLEGERLIWDEGARELRSDGFVRITTPTERLQGYSLVADESLDTYRLARITGQVEVED
jgi:LPS export ABC transporter protein LptC